MKFETTPQFLNDLRRLRREHRSLFNSRIADFNMGCERYLQTRLVRSWRSSLRVARMTGTEQVWEMTWSFRGPDGRATFQFVERDGDTVVLWRRIGTHQIYRDKEYALS